MRAGVGAVALALLAAGCGGKLTRGLASQEVVVYFSAQATQADHVAVLHACSGLPGTSPEPLPAASAPRSSQVYDVRFRVDHATNRQLSDLLSCLSGQSRRGVLGYDIPDNTN